MEVLKDYPKEFKNLFRRSFDFLFRVNVIFFFEDESFVKKYSSFFYIVPCLLLFYITMGINVCKLAIRKQIIELAYVLPLFLIVTQALLKGIVLMPKIPLLTSIIKELGSIWRSTGLTEIQVKERDEILKGVNLCNGVAYWISIIGTAQYLMTPLLETIVRKYFLGEDCELLLAVESSFPFNFKENWATYAAVYVYHTYCLFLSVFLYIGTGMIIITLCALLSLEFTLLGEEMKHIKPDSMMNRTLEEKLELNSISEIHTFCIRDFIARHQKLCVLATQLDEACNQMIFINLLFVGITTCFFRYAAQFSRGPTYMVNNYTAVFTSLMFVLYLCYYGELLTRASLRIGDMAYNSLWYKGDKEHQKVIFVIIKRSQKPCCLTSMKYAPITLNMFTKVISTTWSYFSLMNTVYGDENE